MEQGDPLGSEQTDAARNRSGECSNLSGAAQSPHNGALAHALAFPDQGTNPDLSETLDEPVVLIEKRNRNKSRGIQAPGNVEQTLVRATGSPILVGLDQQHTRRAGHSAPASCAMSLSSCKEPRRN